MMVPPTPSENTAWPMAANTSVAPSNEKSGRKNISNLSHTPSSNKALTTRYKTTTPNAGTNQRLNRSIPPRTPNAITQQTAASTSNANAYCNTPSLRPAAWPALASGSKPMTSP